MTIHTLKTWPVYFDRLVSGEKTFEVHKDDRGYQTGDTLVLREWDPDRCPYHGTCKDDQCSGYTRREITFKVGFIFKQGVGVDLGAHVVMSLLPERAGGGGAR